MSNPSISTVSRTRASSDPLSRGGAFIDDNGTLEREPNPFEQSFSGPHQGPGGTQVAPGPSRSREPAVTAVAPPPRRARSNSPVAPSRLTPGGLAKLPPMSFASTPNNELSSYGWSDSLRHGPLSPALLNAAQAHHNLFDPSSLRTGLTPITSGVSFPPPSPATAALFAMMTNNTPGTAEAIGLAGGGPRPHEGVNEGNHFEASFAQATDKGQDGRRSTESGQHDQYHPRSSLTAALGSQPPQSIAPLAMHPSQQLTYQQMMQLQQQQAQQQQRLPAHEQQMHFQRPPVPQQHHSQPQQPQYGNQNPLYLLSQAQDLSSHNDDAVVAAAALSNLGGPLGYQSDSMASPSASANGVVPGAVGGSQLAMPQITTRGRTAASSPASTNGGRGDSLPPVSAKGGKRGAAAAGNKRKAKDEDKKPVVKKGRRGKAVSPDEMDDMDDMGMGMDDEEGLSPRPHNPNETEEEKRKNFLERNRQAALKCRQRKKAWLANLQSKVELLTTDNDTLQSTVTNLKDEVASLRAILAAHSNCPIASSNQDRRQQMAGGHFTGGAQRF